jgi:hypothetical protein
MDPDGTPTVVIGNLSDLSVTMSFVSPLSCARSLKSGRWTTALPTDAVPHPTAGLTSRPKFGSPKIALNHVVARQPADEGDHGRDVAAFGLARFTRLPANYLRASSRKAIGRQILRQSLDRISDPLEWTVHLPVNLAMRKNGAADDTPNWPRTSNASKPWYSLCSDMRHTLSARGLQRSIWAKYQTN